MEYKFVVFVIIFFIIEEGKCILFDVRGASKKESCREGGRQRERGWSVVKGERYMKTRMFHSSLSTFDRYQVKFGV